MTRSEAKRRVVITGLGVVAPNGQDLDSFWKSICRGESAISLVTRFNVEKMPCKLAAEVKDQAYLRYLDRRQIKRLGLSTQFGIAAAKAALDHSGIQMARMDQDRIGVIEATTVNNLESAFDGMEVYESKGFQHLSPFHLINTYCGGGSGEIALTLGVRGLAVTYSSGSASGNDAIGYAHALIQDDEVDAMIVGGAEAPLLRPFFGGFCNAKVMSESNHSPKESMRPFDVHRNGFVLGEGGAFLVLEEYSHAIARGAAIYAEILGHGRSCEAHHSVAPHPQGIGLKRAMEKAFRKSGIEPGKVDYINAHGTATASNDTVETVAIKSFFGSHAPSLAISSTKPVTGHLLAAAGALETIICALAVHKQEMPPTINLKCPAPDCDLDYLPLRSRPYPIRCAVNLNVGFGGKNSCLVMSRPHG